MENTLQLLTFFLDDEIFAFEINKVREVLEFDRVTKVPQTPDYLRGVINLRGKVVSVIDIKLKFGISRIEKGIDTCIIIVEVNLDGEEFVLGVMVDSVKEVLEVSPEEVAPAPKIGTSLKTEFIKGMVQYDENFLMILDVEKIFSEEELDLAQSTHHAIPVEKTEEKTGTKEIPKEEHAPDPS